MPISPDWYDTRKEWREDVGDEYADEYEEDEDFKIVWKEDLGFILREISFINGHHRTKEIEFIAEYLHPVIKKLEEMIK